MKEKFVISTIILIIGGFLTKALGMVIKIVMSRLMGPEGIGLYMLILPTFMLLIGLTQFGFPLAISKLVSEDKKNNKTLLFSLLPISFIINLIIIITIIIFSPLLANNLLHEPRSYYPLLAIAIVLPLTSLSGMLRSYFFGKQKMLPHVISNVTEDIIRLILIIIGVPIFINNGIEVAVTFIILTNIISELTSILVLFFFLPKKTKVKKEELRVNKKYTKEALSISIPSTTSRLIGSLGYFLEPIILTSILIYLGYDNNYIIREYGIISGYVIPILLLPSFFTMAISQALLPVVSKAHTNNQKDYTKRKIKQAIFFSLIIGIPSTILFFSIPEVFLSIIYNTTEGSNYLRIMAIPFILLYIQAPLSSSIDAMGQSKKNMKITLIGMLIRCSTLTILTFLNIGMLSLIISSIISVLITTYLETKTVKKLLK